MEPYEITVKVYGIIEKEVANGGTSGRVFVPKEWTGKKVKILLMEDITQ